MQAVLDDRIKELVNEMVEGCNLAKQYAPQNNRNKGLKNVVRDILKEVIKGASIVKLYCEKRPSGASYRVQSIASRF